MKRIYLGLLVVTLLFTSCNKDLLELKPYDQLSDAAIWKDINLVNAYVAENYNSLSMTTWGSPGGWGNYNAVYGYFTGGATDEIFELHDKDGWMIKADWIVRGELSPSNISPLGRWARNYSLIRSINNYFKYVDVIEGDAAKISRFTSEMYFLRAFNYVHLVKNYGGVPIITKVFSAVDTEFEEERKSFDDCVKFVLEDLDKAIAGLPATYDAANMGRATKGAAMALKANFLLFVASPLNNPSNDQAKWKAASDAAKAVIDLPDYSLYKPALYENIFLDRANSEVILARYYNSTAAGWSVTNFENTQNRDLAPNSYGGWGLGTPIQNIVDDFEMADGTAFDWNNPVHAAKPYENRDPRFYATIFSDGIMHRGKTVDTYEGGKDNPIGATVERTNASLTGYYLRKFVNPGWETTKWESDCMAIFFRLTEIYLNYAEAQNALGNDTEANKYLNMIRERAQMPAITASGTNLRDKIRHERRIELAFEGQRYYDVRRWKILEQTMGNAIGIKIDKNADGTKTYTRKTVQTRIYTEKVYWQPIPITEIQKNARLVQNPLY